MLGTPAPYFPANQDGHLPQQKGSGWGESIGPVCPVLQDSHPLGKQG